MQTVTVSTKFQLVIPKEMRESLKLAPGQKVQALLYENRIELIPVRPIKKMRGFLKGIDTTIDRERRSGQLPARRIFRGQDPEKRQARRSAGRAADEI